MKPAISLQLVWEHDLIFGGHSGAASITLDSAAQAGPSPVQALAFALAGCMGMDVVHILQRGRYALRGLGIELIAERAPENPHRIVAVDMRFAVTGDVPDAHVQRALDLSQERYCSVWHSMRHDIELKTSFTVTAANR